MQMLISEKIPSRLEIIPDFLSGLIKKLASYKKLNLQEDDLFSIKLSLEEGLVNAVKHGNKLNNHLSVTVEVELDSSSLIFRIKDQGKGFDYGKIPDPTKKENIKKISGRGIFLINNLMDKVEYFDSGRELRMTKIIRKKGVKGES